MLKSRKLSLAAVLALLGATLVAPPAWAATVDCSAGGSFTITDNVVTGSTNCAGTATIPSTVTSIGDAAFAPDTMAGEVSVLNSIIIPSSVASIGKYAFQSASVLDTVTFTAGSTLVSIGNQAFYGATSLSSIAIPSSVTSIGRYAFSGTSLASITFYGNAPSVGDNVFSSVGSSPKAYIGLAANGFGDGTTWNGLTIVRTSDSSVDCGAGGSFTITDNVVTGNTNCAGEAVIPNSVTSIGNRAFFGTTSLTSITIPNSVTSIGGFAFYNTALTSITIPNSVISIGYAAFYNATALTSITIPNSVTSIGDTAFGSATALTSVTFEADGVLASIGNAAFDGATALTSITIPNSVTTIGRSAFYNATALTSITIPNSVTSIGDSAFSGATALNSITFEAGSVLTSIGKYAFRNASALTSIIIPNSVTSIGEYAFDSATALTSVTFEGNAPTASGTAFNNVSGAVANIGSAATGFGGGTTWNGLTIVRNAGIPEVTWVTDYVIYEGFELELYGTDLDTVIGLRLGGINLKIDSKTATSIITTIPAGIAEADYSIYMTHPGGTKMHPWKFTMQAPITPVISDELKAWTKNLNDGTAKIYAKNIVGGGKIRFMLNGKEIAWVRAVSAADPKLRTANGAHYLVRTVDLVEGQKNVLEVYLDGVRIKRTAYSY